ncbi:HAD family hydrolase [Oceanobacillus polygoni]|uniref:Hydrolase of the HAD superfamily n=1 Tax=Oceanobacillus polygoni TaxID=1235259 RepID=A0A9X1CE97_9BACI|nr:HAD family hydrolase [Oceanobacillus polygoni]MBP2076915.1 putative hydrolase of the HAD superfamily [Oceanobacillus polygoni]
MDTIIFDVDDTLYDQAASFKNTCKKMIDVPFTDEELNNFYIISRKHSDALFDDQVAGKITVQEMHIRRIKDACTEIGIAMTEQQAIDFQEAYVAEQQKIALFDEVIELLDLLVANNKQLAVLTNGAEGHQSMKINQLKLDRWFPEDNLFISGAIGHAKPSKEAFTVLENKLGLEKSKTIYIGDSFANDIVGAKQAGWHAVWMNHRKRDMPENSVQPDKVVYSAKELLDLFSDELLVVK